MWDLQGSVPLITQILKLRYGQFLWLCISSESEWALTYFQRKPSSLDKEAGNKSWWVILFDRSGSLPGALRCPGLCQLLLLQVQNKENQQQNIKDTFSFWNCQQSSEHWSLWSDRGKWCGCHWLWVPKKPWGEFRSDWLPDWVPKMLTESKTELTWKVITTSYTWLVLYALVL